MKKLLSLIFAIAFSLTLGACGGSGGGGSTPPDSTGGWTSLPKANPVKYTHGAIVSVATVTVDTMHGGVLQGRDETPLEGVIVTIPAGAVTVPTMLSLGYDATGTFTNLPAAMKSNVVLVLESNGTHVFAQPLKVEFPHTDPDPSHIPVPFYINGSGALEVLTSVPAEPGSGLRNFITWHASDFTWFSPTGEYLPPVGLQFLPSTDGFSFKNSSAKYTFPSSSSNGGRCWGMSYFAKWYRDEVGSGLYKQFQDVVPTFYKGPLQGNSSYELMNQWIIATRATIALIVPPHSDPSEMSDADFIQYVRFGLAGGANGVLVGLRMDSGGKHAVLAIGYNDTQIAIYDPNYPGVIKAIDYTLNPAKLEPYVGGNYTYNKFKLWWNGDPSRLEQYPSILEDAKAKFNGENETQIEITSHKNHDVVSNNKITLKGKVHSGQVMVEKVTIVITKPNGDYAQQILERPNGTKDFDFDLTLDVGETGFTFDTEGQDATGEMVRLPTYIKGGDPETDPVQFFLKVENNGVGHISYSSTWNYQKKSTAGTDTTVASGNGSMSFNSQLYVEFDDNGIYRASNRNPDTGSTFPVHIVSSSQATSTWKYVGDYGRKYTTIDDTSTNASVDLSCADASVSAGFGEIGFLGVGLQTPDSCKFAYTSTTTEKTTCVKTNGESCTEGGEITFDGPMPFLWTWFLVDAPASGLSGFPIPVGSKSMTIKKTSQNPSCADPDNCTTRSDVETITITLPER
jgi:hypothetical protein